MQLDFFAAFVSGRALRTKPLPRESGPKRREAAARGDDAALTEIARQWLSNAGCRTMAQTVSVRWNPRMRSTAGTARVANAVIDLNPRLREFGEEELLRTLKHEVAHLIAFARAGRRRIAPHGREWRAACEEFGLHDESRCHTLPLPTRRVVRRHFYQCPVCRIEVRRVRPFRRRCACLACCRAHAHGRYDERFRFVKLRPG